MFLYVYPFHWGLCMCMFYYYILTMNIKHVLVAKKQEMTRIWVDAKQVPVTLVKVCDQEVIRYKVEETDGYNAMVLWVWKKKKKSSRGNEREVYDRVVEFHVWLDTVDNLPIWSSCDIHAFSDISSVRIVWRSKGKGFQWVMKRHNFGWWPATHGSKFHRAWWSTGNRKPRRTIRWRKMAWHMGDEKITLRSVPLLDIWQKNNETFLVLKGSIPGARNSYVDVVAVA